MVAALILFPAFKYYKLKYYKNIWMDGCYAAHVSPLGAHFL